MKIFIDFVFGSCAKIFGNHIKALEACQLPKNEVIPESSFVSPLRLKTHVSCNQNRERGRGRERESNWNTCTSYIKCYNIIARPKKLIPHSMCMISFNYWFAKNNNTNASYTQ